MKRLCIIPARGGSKRVKQKNLRDFCGKPMFSHALGAVLDANIFSKVHVSTDNDTINSVAEQLGANQDFMRPSGLADDHTDIMTVLKHTLLAYAERGEIFEVIALVYATCPLLRSTDLIDACNQFEQSDGVKALLAVTPFPIPIEKAWRMEEDQTLAPQNANAFKSRTQDILPSYHDAGMFCFYSADYIKNSSGAGNPLGFRGYQVPSYLVTDIDEPEDWTRTEYLFKAVQLAKKD